MIWRFRCEFTIFVACAAMCAMLVIGLWSAGCPLCMVPREIRGRSFRSVASHETHTDSPQGVCFAQHRLRPADTVLPESRVVGRWDGSPSDGGAQGVRSVPARKSGAVRSLAAPWEAEPGYLRIMADSAAHLCGVPPDLFAALISRESSWNPRARSSAGAVGLGQLMPGTALEMGVHDRRDPWQNLLASACYLAKLRGSGTWRDALHSYHGGPNRTRTSRKSRDYASDIIGSAQ